MKRLLLPILAVMLFASFGFSANKSSLRTNNSALFLTDTIKTGSFTFHASRATEANNPNGVKSLLDSIKTYPASSYILVKRVGKGEWVIETKPNVSALSNYNPKKLVLIEGDIAIMHTKYDTRYAVIMQ